MSIGEYVSKQIDVNGWGKSTVKALSEYILSKESGIRGYSSQNIWRMKQFYETYKDKPVLINLMNQGLAQSICFNTCWIMILIIGYIIMLIHS